MTPIAATFGRMLAQFALNGRFTLEDLDAPSSVLHFTMLEADRQAANSRAVRRGHRPVFGSAIPWRNLAREWIAAHPAEWQSLLMRSLDQEEEP
jgi:hypothetical protein